MAGRKGRSGPIAAHMQEWCAAVIREDALPKMRRCITSKTPDRTAFRWCVEQLAKMGNLYAPVQHEHSGVIEVQDAARRFESRTDRLVARLGTAAMAEWPER
jgi:hypothetical protein